MRVYDAGMVVETIFQTRNCLGQASIYPDTGLCCELYHGTRLFNTNVHTSVYLVSLVLSIVESLNVVVCNDWLARGNLSIPLFISCDSICIVTLSGSLIVLVCLYSIGFAYMQSIYQSKLE